MTDPIPVPDPTPTPEPIPTPDPSELPSIDEPVLDLGREMIRQHLVAARDQVTTEILTLRSDFVAAQSVVTSSAGGLKQLAATVAGQQQQIAALQAALAQAQTDIAALQTAVAALQPPAPTTP